MNKSVSEELAYSLAHKLFNKTAQAKKIAAYKAGVEKLTKSAQLFEELGCENISEELTSILEKLK